MYVCEICAVLHFVWLVSHIPNISVSILSSTSHLPRPALSDNHRARISVSTNN